MTRTEAIDLITRALPALNDERLREVADLLQAVGGDSALPRPFTDHELALIEQSREDFRQGRTMTSAEARASIDNDLAKLGVPKSTA